MYSLCFSVCLCCSRRPLLAAVNPRPVCFSLFCVIGFVAGCSLLQLAIEKLEKELVLLEEKKAGVQAVQKLKHKQIALILQSLADIQATVDEVAGGYSSTPNAYQSSPRQIYRRWLKMEKLKSDKFWMPWLGGVVRPEGRYTKYYCLMRSTCRAIQHNSIHLTKHKNVLVKQCGCFFACHLRVEKLFYCVVIRSTLMR